MRSWPCSILVAVGLFVSGCGGGKEAPDMSGSAAAPGCAGQLGCTCNAAGKCDDAEAFCDSTRHCSKPVEGCTPGTLECACAGGGCNGTLRCVQGVCRDNTGFAGGACIDGNHCQTGNRCTDGVCVACSPGTQGCTCKGDGTCNDPSQCSDGMCVTSTGYGTEATASTPPDCVTACSGPLVAPDGTYVPCPADGVMEGCLPGMTCEKGQCLCPGSSPKTCTSDNDCAQYHTCLDGYCRTNCNVDSDCRSDAACYKHVCHKKCDIATGDCAEGDICQPTADGQTGVCAMRADSLVAATDQAANLTLGSQVVSFTPSHGTGSFTVQNTSAFATTVVVRKTRELQAGSNVTALELLARETPPAVDGNGCPPGALGCKCGSDASQPCVKLSSSVSLTCENNLCQLPVCQGGTQGCYCNGSDCRLVCEGGRCPLAWLAVTVEVDNAKVVTSSTDEILAFALGANKTATVTVTAPEQAKAWTGSLEVEPRGGGSTRQSVALSYTKTPDGLWGGTMYYFGDFSVDVNGLDAWEQVRDSADDTTLVNLHNAFLRKWADFRRRHIDYKTMTTILTATRSGSWKSPVLKAACGNLQVCYPDDSPAGYSYYTYSPTTEPVPDGVVEMPFGVILTATNDPLTYGGAVDSGAALQYPGSPAANFHFVADPGACQADGAGNCITFLDSLQLSSVVGGRYRRPASGACNTGFRDTALPWLVPGFTPPDGSSDGMLHECREATAPYGAADDATRLRDQALAGTNPRIDGMALTRTIELIDGAIINGQNMLLLFREATPALFGGQTSYAYGFISLKRSNLPKTAPTPVQATPAPSANAAPPVSCDNLPADLYQAITSAYNIANNKPNGTDPPDPATLARALLTGSVSAAAPKLTPELKWAQTGEQVHYLCADTRRFDGTLWSSDNASSAPVPCPLDSPVTFFTVSGSGSYTDLAIQQHACQQDQTCDTTLANWIAKGNILVQSQPAWRCADASAKTCDGDPFERRAGKSFYDVSARAVALPLDTAVAQAFQYRTRFVNRNGKNLGFAPEICGEDTQPLSYCYAPGEIEDLDLRYDCLIDLFLNQRPALLSAGLGDSVLDALRTSFASGFEKLRAELLVMLGDEAYTQSLSSRFDLAGLSGATFPGSKLEPNGIDLSGVAGAAMRNLYVAQEYYQLAIDRLSKLQPAIGQLVALTSFTPPIIGQAAAVDFMSREIRASSQKAQVASEFAKQYVTFNRPDLARGVIERGYIGGYLESAMLTSTMTALEGGVYDAQISLAIQNAELTYSAALSGMEEQYLAIGDSQTYFGLPADYIPFPALEASIGRDSAFDVADARARDLVNIAAQAEDVALQTSRSFDTDAVSFQNEITQVSQTYENQLADLCGTFTGSDGVVYPAIAKYAYLSPRAQALGDPCGRLGTGQIADQINEVLVENTELMRVQETIKNTLEEAEIERQRISEACGTNADWEDAVVTSLDKQYSISDKIRELQLSVDEIDHLSSAAITSAQAAQAAESGNPLAAIAAGGAVTLITATATAQSVADIALDDEIKTHEAELQAEQNNEATLQFQFQCDSGGQSDANGNPTGQGLLEIDSRAKVQDILVHMSELQLDVLREGQQIQATAARINQLQNQAKRVAAQEEQNLQLAIDLEAARNDPNVRIYRNDAVIHADTTFEAALQEVYRATRVFEYYTSQSYPEKDKLFLARLVSRGDVNLLDYLIGLENAFHSFEDDIGVADSRVLVLSMRDDLLAVPSLNTCGEPLSTNDRVKLMQQRLSDPAALDENGYVVVPFRIGPELVSPLTRDHKVTYVEAQIVGGKGDQVGRVYVRMAGSALVSTLDDETQFFSFPRRTGVIDAFFSVKAPEFDPAVYRTSRFYERPLMNSRWELVLNLKDEPANLDFGVRDISDIRLYFYYTDFTRY